MRKLMMKFTMSAVFLLSLTVSAFANADGSACNNISDEAIKKICIRAADGDAEAQFNLGVMYSQGQDVTQSDAETMKWYRLAAEQGVASAQYNLGVMHETGRGVPQSDTEAVKWYRLAAEQGLAIALFNLGGMYADGRGVVPQNDVFAHMWFDLAAAQGHSDGRVLRDHVARRMAQFQIADAQKLASECMAKNYKGC